MRGLRVLRALLRRVPGCVRGQKNGKRVDAELRGHGEYGWECQFLYDGELAYGRRWTMRAAAIAEAEAKRLELEAAGWVVSG